VVSEKEAPQKGASFTVRQAGEGARTEPLPERDGNRRLMATVETRNIRKYFGDVRAVDGVDLSTAEGEILVLLGPSGCGKTTLLRVIAGLEEPTSGEILIGGQVVNDLPPRARKIAMVFQSYALYPHMTVFKNIAFPLKAQRVPKETWQSKVE